MRTKSRTTNVRLRTSKNEHRKNDFVPLGWSAYAEGVTTSVTLADATTAASVERRFKSSLSENFFGEFSSLLPSVDLLMSDLQIDSSPFLRFSSARIFSFFFFFFFPLKSLDWSQEKKFWKVPSSLFGFS